MHYVRKFLYLRNLADQRKGIKQDNISDWTEATGYMADVYKNGFVTIAAAWSQSSAGVLYSELGREFSAVPLAKHNMFVWRAILSPFHDQGNPDLKLLETWPLFTRGWAFQERQISPRVIYFGSNEILWTCKSIQQSHSQGPQESRLTVAHNDFDIGARDYSNITWYYARTWYNTVQVYSKLKFTFEKDRLPALAALAEQASEDRDGDVYVARLWKKTLLDDLQWRASRLDKSRRRPEGWTGPSWSRASIAGHVEWSNARESRPEAPILSEVRVVDLQYQPEVPRYTGNVINARLTIFCPLLTATPLMNANWRSHYVTASHPRQQAFEKFDVWYDQLNGPNPAPDPRTVYAAMLTRKTGLLLRKQPNKPAQFERISIAYAPWYHEFELSTDNPYSTITIV